MCLCVHASACVYVNPCGVREQLLEVSSALCVSGNQTEIVKLGSKAFFTCCTILKYLRFSCVLDSLTMQPWLAWNFLLDQVDLELRDLSASASGVMKLKSYTSHLTNIFNSYSFHNLIFIYTIQYTLIILYIIFSYIKYLSFLTVACLVIFCRPSWLTCSFMIPSLCLHSFFLNVLIQCFQHTNIQVYGQSKSKY